MNLTNSSLPVNGETSAAAQVTQPDTDDEFLEVSVETSDADPTDQEETAGKQINGELSTQNQTHGTGAVENHVDPICNGNKTECSPSRRESRGEEQHGSFDRVKEGVQDPNDSQLALKTLYANLKADREKENGAIMPFPPQTFKKLEEFADNEGKLYKCSVCAMQFARHSSLMWHVQSHGTSQNLKGRKPDEDNSLSVVNSNQTVQTASSDEPIIIRGNRFICGLCYKEFEFLRSVRFHITRCHKFEVPVDPAPDLDLNTTTCNICDREFESIKAMRVHTSHVHNRIDTEEPNENGMFSCSMCEKQFVSTRARKVHVAHAHRSSIQPMQLNESNAVSSVDLPNEFGMFGCNFCSKEFNSATARKIHVSHMHRRIDDLVLNSLSSLNMTPGEDGPYNCDYCDKIFDTVKGKSVHISHMHKIDSQSHNSTSNLSNTVVSADSATDENGIFGCDYCDKEFDSEKGRRVHVTRLHKFEAPEDPASDEETAAFTCDYCFREFASSKAVSVHVWHAHRFASKMKQSVDSSDETSIPYGSNVFGCEFCDRTFESAKARLIHTSHVHKKSSFAETTQNDSVNSTFGEEGPSECELCGKEFNSLKAVKIHKAHKHPFANAIYYCKPCNKRFPSLRAQKVHMLRIHKGQSCDDSTMELDKEVSVSNGESVFPCHLCERTFWNKKGLSRHIGYHTSTQQLLSKLSDTCKDVLLAPMDDSTTDGTDNNLNVLSADENVVSESLQCPVCNKGGFESRKAVKIHSSRMHSGIEVEFDEGEDRDEQNFPINCDYCEKKFRSEYGKNVHKFRMHKLLINKRDSSGNSLVMGNEIHFPNGQEHDEQESFVFEDSLHQNSINSAGPTRVFQNESVNMSNVPEQFDCSYCDRSFNSIKARSAHLKVHIRHSRQFNDTVEESAEKIICQVTDDTVEEPLEKLANVEILNHVKDCASSSVSTPASLSTKQYVNLPMEIDHQQSDHVITNTQTNRIYKVTQAKENIFKCNICPKAFNKSKALANHCRMHQFQCQICSKTFISIKTLRMHMKNHGRSYGTHVSVLSTNDKIGDQFAQKVDVATKLDDKVVAECRTNASAVGNTDIKVKTEELKCPHCPRSFKNLKAISTHSRSHSENKNISTNSLSMVNPVEVATENDKFRCLYCRRLFSNAKAVAVHSRIHRMNGQLNYSKEVVPTPNKVSSTVNEVKQFKCSICSKTFDTERGLQFHSNVHSSHAHKCMHCERLFDNVKGLAGHMKIHKGQDVKEVLEVTLGKEDEVEEEEAEDMNESCNSYPCKYCERVFTTLRGLRRHTFIHSNEIPPEPDKHFTCRYCGMEFANGKQLGGHMRHHTLILQKDPHAYNSILVDIDGIDADLNEEDQLICDTCDEVFECREDLSEHVRSHTLDPLLLIEPEATQNSSVLDQRDSLSAGPSAHTGYTMCHICNQLFSSGENLNAHMYKKHRWANRKATSSLLQKDLSTPISVGRNQSTALTSNRKRSLTPEIIDLEGDSIEDPIYVPGTAKSKRVCTPDQHQPGETQRNVSSAGSKSAFGVRKNSEIYAKNQPNLSAQFWESFHECMFCKKRFSGKSKYLEHVRTHPESHEYNDEDLENYTNTQDSESFVLQNQDGNDEHFVFEQNEEKDGYRCTECEETFQDKLQMLIHISYHRDSKLPNGEQKSLLIKADSSLLAPFKCNFCGQRFINKKYRNLHLCKQHRSDILQCEICQKLFICKETLKQHHEQHAQEKRYQCEFCGECFASKSVLKRHTDMQCQTNEIVEPGIVDEQNTEINTDIPAIKQEPRQIEDDFEDNELETNAPSRNTMLSREESNSIEQKFKPESVGMMSHVCACCNKRFASEVDMQNHENHPQKILYCCGLCNLFFVDCRSAEVHSKMHIMETDLDLD